MQIFQNSQNLSVSQNDRFRKNNEYEKRMLMKVIKIGTLNFVNFYFSNFQKYYLNPKQNSRHFQIVANAEGCVVLKIVALFPKYVCDHRRRVIPN